MAITYLSDKMFLHDAVASDVAFGSNPNPTQGWSEKPLYLAGKTLVGGTTERTSGTGKVDVWNWGGSAFVFKHEIDHPDDTPNSDFAAEIAMDKSKLIPLLLVVSAPAYLSSTGRVYVFERADIFSNFVLVAKFEASDKESNDSFGNRIAVDETNGVIAVAAKGWDDPTYANAGKVYFFEKDDVTGWPGDLVTPGTEDASIVSPYTAGTGYYFGSGLAIRNGHALVGYGGQSYKGLEYFLRQSKSSWTHQQQYNPGAPTVGFGPTVDMDQTATYAVAGARDSDRVVIIKRTGTGGSSWTKTDDLIKGASTDDMWFGTIASISPDGSSVLIGSAGAYWPDDIGSAWYFDIDENGDLQNEQRYEAEDAEDSHYFASTIAWNGYRLLIGACGDDEAAENAGALYDKGIYNYPSITPSVISTAGGEELALAGSFPVGTAVEAFLGPTGDETDEPCYSGNSGDGYSPISTDGENLVIISPPMSKGDRKITIRYGGQNYQLWNVEVVEHAYSSVLYEVRRSWPKDFSTGPRDMTVEPEQ